MSDFFFTFNGGIVLGLMIVLPVWGIVSLIRYIQGRKARRIAEEQNKELFRKLRELQERRRHE